MRPIDADALIEILATAIRNMQGMAMLVGAEGDPEIQMEIKAYTDILNGVKEQPTIEPEPHWIPVSERLPEKDDTYIVSGVWESGKKQVGECNFQVDDGYFDTSWNFDVEAWMPLPEPYKEGDE